MINKTRLLEFSGGSLECLECAFFYDVIVHQKRLSDTEKMQYQKINLTGSAKPVNSGLGFG